MIRVDAIVDDLVNFKVPGVAILDPAKAGIVGIKTAIAVKPKRAEAKIANLITEEQFQEGIKKCTTATSAPLSVRHISGSASLLLKRLRATSRNSPTSMRFALAAEDASRSARRASISWTYSSTPTVRPSRNQKSR